MDQVKKNAKKYKNLRINLKAQKDEVSKAGCLQIQTNKFQGYVQEISKTHLTVPWRFLHWSSLLSITTWDTNTCTFSYVQHYE